MVSIGSFNNGQGILIRGLIWWPLEWELCCTGKQQVFERIIQNTNIFREGKQTVLNLQQMVCGL
jgi:hypothetical protein